MRTSGEGRGTVSSDVMIALRRDIIDGRLAPGARLKFAEIQASYGAGIGTLREALSGLVAEGIVTVDAGRGFRVAEVSEEDLLDLVALRTDVERRAIEDSVTHGDDDWEARVLTAWHRLSKVSDLPDRGHFTPDTEWIARHRDFHAALVSACRSRRILQFRAVLYHQAERYRQLSIRHGSPQTHQHDQLKDAALARDARLAGDILVRHIVESAELVRKFSPQLARAEKPSDAA